jgi:hypothetical protein
LARVVPQLAQKMTHIRAPVHGLILRAYPSNGRTAPQLRPSQSPARIEKASMHILTRSSRPTWRGKKCVD